MGRLIDADAFKRQIAGMTIANSYSVNKANALCELIDAQPIAFDLDKVVEQLEKKIQTHARCIEYEKKNGTITEEFQQRKAVKEFRIWCQCNNPYGVACTSVRNIKCNRPIHHDYGVISLPNGQCV